MKNLRNLTVLIPLVIIVSAFVGFLITFQSSPPAAYARIFIDLGVLVALMIGINDHMKPRGLPTEDIVNALRDLARGHYDRRMNPDDLGELSDIGRAFNELAGTLSDSGDPAVNRTRYQSTRKIEAAVQRVVTNEFHSHHPELGPVIAIAKEETPVPQAPKTLPPPTPDLYTQFCEAHRQIGREPIDFETFEQTISQTREELIRVHNCRDIRFEVAVEGDEIALRPRLLR